MIKSFELVPGDRCRTAAHKGCVSPFEADVSGGLSCLFFHPGPDGGPPPLCEAASPDCPAGWGGGRRTEDGPVGKRERDAVAVSPVSLPHAFHVAAWQCCMRRSECERGHSARQLLLIPHFYEEDFLEDCRVKTTKIC